MIGDRDMGIRIGTKPGAMLIAAVVACGSACAGEYDGERPASSADASESAAGSGGSAGAGDPAAQQPAGGSAGGSGSGMDEPTDDSAMADFDNPSARSGAGDPASAGSGGAAGGQDPSTGAGSDMGSTSMASGDDPDCGVVTAVMRDFRDDHPDFESFTGDGLQGIVQPELGDDDKPVYAHTGGTLYTTGPDEFAQWYNDVDGVNERIEIEIALEQMADGRYVYDNDAFFPLDDQGFGNQGREHNFHFTTEIHTRFTYRGGETFTFTGDDDLYLFINGKLAIDLGGLHPSQSDTVDMDASAAMLGIEVGETYPMDIFHAERHTSHSNFRLETTIGCLVDVAPD